MGLQHRTRILLIDAPEQSQMYAEGLESQGYEAVMASSCELAIELARIARPAVIVLDVRLRDGAGWETCQRLTSDPVTRGIPVIVLTASVFDADEAVAREMGAAVLVHKPCSPAHLMTIIRSLESPDVNAPGRQNA